MGSFVPIARVGELTDGTMLRDINFMVGGEAGQGVQSVGFLLRKFSLVVVITFSLTRTMSPG